MSDWREIAGDQNLRLSAKMLEQQGQINDLTAERDRYRTHSVTLNTIAWKLAVALGDAAPDADAIVGDPVEQADRLIAKLEQLRAGLREHWAALYDDGSWTSGSHDTRPEAEEIIAESPVTPAPILAMRWITDWQPVASDVETRVK